MIQPNGNAGKVDLAIAWYKQGKCPGCGKSQGESRGLEYRVKSRDLYCHTCKRRWPVEIDPTALRDELLPSQFHQAEGTPLSACDPALPPGEPAQSQKGWSKLVGLFHRIALG
jgi:hypothetical protein